MHRLHRPCMRLAAGCAAWSSSVAATLDTTTTTPSRTHLTCPRGRLVVVHPELVDDWIPELNNANVETLLCSSPLPAWWRCARCERRYCAAVRDRVTRGVRCCPHCHGDAVTASGEAGPDAVTGDALTVSHPTLAARWDTTRNGVLTAAHVTATSTRCVWWRGRSTDADHPEHFCRAVCAFVADPRSPGEMTRAQATFEWRLLQRIHDAVHDGDVAASPKWGVLPPEQIAARIQPDDDDVAQTTCMEWRATEMKAVLELWRRRVEPTLHRDVASRRATTPVHFGHGVHLTELDAARVRTGLLNAYYDVAVRAHRGTRATSSESLPCPEPTPMLLDDTAWLDFFRSARLAPDTAVESTSESQPLSTQRATRPFPPPPSAEALALAAAQASEAAAHIPSERGRRAGQDSATSLRTARLFERFMTGMTPEEEEQLLASYPRWRPFALYTSEDDVMESTPIETSFYAAARMRGRKGVKPRRTPTTLFSFPTADEPDVALDVSAVRDDDGDLDLATRLRAEAVGESRGKDSLVDFAVRALGGNAIVHADAQAVQIEQEVMQALRPYSGRAKDTSGVGDAATGQQKRVRLQMPSEVQGTNGGLITAPRTPRKVARPRRATSETST